MDEPMENTNQRWIYCMLGYYNMPGIYQFETAEYHFDFFSLYREASEFMKGQLKQFHDQFYEWFNLDDYPDSSDWLTEEELQIFGERLQSEEIGDVFDALSDVLIQRLGIQSIESLKKAEELFNYIMNYGLSEYNAEHRNSNEAATWIAIGPPETFGSFFVDYILKQIRISESKGIYGSSAIGELMAPLRSIVEAMKRIVDQKDWAKNELHVGRLLTLIDIYQTLAESQYDG
jgi:hypothetical protein